MNMDEKDGADMKAAKGEKLSKNADVNYARQMIPHHESAVQMSEMIISKGSNAEIKAFAQKVITAQTKEIAFLEGWLESNA